MSEFYQARVRAEWQEWTFGAHQAATRAAAAEELIALRRQYTELTEPELLRLAESWRSEGVSGPYFVFTAAVGDYDDQSYGRAELDDAEPTLVVVDAIFVSALLRELDDQAPAALAELLDRWAEQRRHAAYAGLRPTHVQPPRVALLLPRDATHWPSASWQGLLALDLDSPQFDGAVLRWEGASGLWSARPSA